MLSYTITFMVVALVAGILGFAVFTGLLAEIAKILFVVGLILFVTSLLASRHPPL